jgi:hypothetical protein
MSNIYDQFPKSCKWTREYYRDYNIEGELETSFEFETECGNDIAFNGDYIPVSMTVCKFCQKPIEEIDPEKPEDL